MGPGPQEGLAEEVFTFSEAQLVCVCVCVLIIVVSALDPRASFVLGKRPTLSSVPCPVLLFLFGDSVSKLALNPPCSPGRLSFCSPSATSF